MKRSKPTQEELSWLTLEDAKRVGKILFEERLRLDWLQLRLERDFGLCVKASYLSEVVNGKRELGKKTRLVVWCCLGIIEKYLEFYGGNR